MTATKVTLTLPNELLEVVDDFVANHAGTTRSGVCAEALRDWLRAQHEAAIERYYQSLSDEERAEDQAWAGIAARSADRLWS
jgi:metal-responsive CopG/Arc/MetJ family transcriptional regulator